MTPNISPGTNPYPAQWQRLARMRDGVQYHIRPIQSDDTQRERAFIVGLSETSRHNRVMAGLREPSAAALEHLVHVDYRSEMAFVALVGGRGNESIIGVARYSSRGNANEGEFAVVVADEWQSRGIGTTLLRLLFEYARTQGFTKMRGTILMSNGPMLSLARSLGMQIHRFDDDATLMEASCELG